MADKNFNFKLVGGKQKPFLGYVSQIDRTIVSPQMMVRGSQNVIVKSSGAIANRPGLKLRGAVDATLDAPTASYEFDVAGNTRPVRVLTSGKLQVEVAVGSSYTWVSLLTGLTGTRFVFTPWYDSAEAKDRLIMVHGTNELLHWSGGVGTLGTTTVTTITTSDTQTLAQLGFSSATPKNLKLLINGNEYSYTGLGLSEAAIYTETSTANDSIISTSRWWSQPFTTGANATEITQASLTLKDTTGGATDAVFLLSIYSDNAGVPGTKLGSALARESATFSAGNYSFSASFSGLTVAGATIYHLVVSQVSGPSVKSVYYASSGTACLLSTDSGSTWVAQAGRMFSSVTENDVTRMTFVGVTPNPTGEAAGSIIVQKVITEQNLPSPAQTNDFIKNIGQRLFVGSYNSRVVYTSANTDFTNFTIPTVRISGSPDKITLDHNVNGFGKARQVGVISAGLADWYEVSWTLTSNNSILVETTVVTPRPSADLQAALSHEFIDAIGDNIVFLSKDQQLLEYGTFRNLSTPKFPSLSLDIKDELSAENFTSPVGHLRAVGDDIFITAPANGRMWWHQRLTMLTELGSIQQKNLWQVAQIVNASRLAVIGGVRYLHSNVNPQLYQFLDTLQWHDDAPSGAYLPYNSVLRLGFINGGGDRRANYVQASKCYYEGYATQGTELDGAVYYEYQGSKTIQAFTITKPSALAQFYVASDAPSLGDASLGDEPLGDGLGLNLSSVLLDQDLLPKFRKINNVGLKNVFEFELEVSSSNADDRWEILFLGPNLALSTSLPTVLQR